MPVIFAASPFIHRTTKPCSSPSSKLAGIVISQNGDLPMTERSVRDSVSVLRTIPVYVLLITTTFIGGSILMLLAILWLSFSLDEAHRTLVIGILAIAFLALAAFAAIRITLESRRARPFAATLEVLADDMRTVGGGRG